MWCLDSRDAGAVRLRVGRHHYRSSYQETLGADAWMRVLGDKQDTEAAAGISQNGHF